MDGGMKKDGFDFGRMMVFWERAHGQLPFEIHRRPQKFETQKYIAAAQGFSFEDALAVETRARSPWLNAWSDRMNRKFPDAGKPAIDMAQTYSDMAKISRAVYLGGGIIGSEDGPIRLWDLVLMEKPRRVYKSEALSMFGPSASSLPFDKITLSTNGHTDYCGFRHDWGFIRLEQEDAGGKWALFLNFLKFDQAVFDVLMDAGLHGPGSALELYADMFNDISHDYVHQVFPPGGPENGVFYLGTDSPLTKDRTKIKMTTLQDSFETAAAAGMASAPMHKLYQLSEKRTGDYELWAALTHRQNFLDALTPAHERKMEQNARAYMACLPKIQKAAHELHEGTAQEKTAFAQRVGEYMVSVYIWPLQMILPHDHEVMNIIREGIEPLDIDMTKAKKPGKADFLMKKVSASDPEDYSKPWNRKHRKHMHTPDELTHRAVRELYPQMYENFAAMQPA